MGQQKNGGLHALLLVALILTGVMSHNVNYYGELTGVCMSEYWYPRICSEDDEISVLTEMYWNGTVVVDITQPNNCGLPKC